jgi:hypothetical protein
VFVFGNPYNTVLATKPKTLPALAIPPIVPAVTAG